MLTTHSYVHLVRYFGCRILILLLTITSSVGAQPRANIEHYSTEHGLSHDGVLCITRDREGFMWFGTWDGLNRFDGHSFKSYKSLPGDSSIVKNNRIRNIVEDKAGFLWVKTYDNLVYRFDKNEESFTSVPVGNRELPGVVIDKIVPASSGDTWLITDGSGLLLASKSKFLRLTKYDKASQPELRLPDNRVSFVFEDLENGTWVGTAKGLVYLKKVKNRFVKASAASKNYNAGYSFTCVDEDAKSVVFGTSSGELISYNKHRRTFKTEKLFENIPINDVYISRGGKIYISGAGNGLSVVDPGNGKIRKNLLSPIKFCYGIYEDRAGRIWVEPEKAGVIKYDPQSNTYKLFTQRNDANASSPNKNYHVFEDVNGHVWAGLKGGGFGLYDPLSDNLEYFYNDPASADHQFSNIVTALYSDPTGILWLSANDGGINKITFPGKNFRHNLWPDQKTRPEKEIRALYQDRSGRLWLASKAGKIFVYRNGRQEALRFEGIGVSDVGKIYSITEDSRGRMWFGTKGGGLVRAVPAGSNRQSFRLTRFVADHGNKYSLSNNQVYSVIEDKLGRIWVGTLGGGLNMMAEAGGKPIFYNVNNVFGTYPSTNNVVRHLQVAADGSLWVATTDGLLVVDAAGSNPRHFRFRKYSKVPGDKSSLSNNDVQYIYKDRSSKMWIGTFGGGLNELISEPGSPKLAFRVYTRNQGLPNDIILSMAEDRDRNLWIATENGMSKLNLRSKEFTNYDAYDGLPRTRFSEAASLRASDGTLYFGCLDGYISFNPRRIKHTLLEATMALTNLQIYNRDILPGKDSPLKSSINYTNRITLSYDQNMISIDYTVLDYRATQKISYAYILKGYDKRWNLVNSQRKATYTNLPPGDYEFVVKGVNEELFKTAPLKSIKITVMPPPWKTVWAYLAYGLLLVIAIEAGRRIFITMIRLRNNVAVEKRLTDLKLQFFTNISHELRTPLTLIVSPLEEIARNEQISARGRRNINIVNRNANRMIRLINQLLDFRKVQSGKMRLKVAEVEVVSLLREVSEYFSKLAEEKEMKLELRWDVPELKAWLDEEKVDIVIYNLLSNAFKFSPPQRTIALELKHHPGESDFSIVVKDQGNGIPRNKLSRIFELYYEGDARSENNLKGTGIGLALSKELIEAHGGTINVENNPEGGTIFVITLKMGKEHFKDKDADFVSSPVLSSFVNSGYAEVLSDETASVTEISEGNVSQALPIVLLVEDNAELRSFLAGQLSPSYHVIEAGDGVEALAAAEKTVPDLVISDVMMPNMDGIEMLDKLKRNLLTSHIPVILLTAKTSVESQIEALKYGADFYITKPFYTDHILASVSNLIRQRKNIYESLLDRDKKIVQLKPDEVFITSKDEEFLKRVIKIVEEGMEDSKFNIDSVADMTGLGRTTFYKKLKSLTGLAPIEFVRDIRLKRGQQLLESGQYTVSEVAYMIGFSSSGYFSTCFREKFKMSPTEYLKVRKEGKVH